MPAVRSRAHLDRARSSACRACPRLVEWREAVAREKRAVVPRRDLLGPAGAGLRRPARPAAASSGSRPRRTAATAPAGCSPATVPATSSSRRCTAAASRTSRRRSALDDGLVLHDAYVAAAVRCAPPANKPTPAERDECAPYLVRELSCSTRVRVIVALGAFGYEAVWSALRAAALPAVELPARRPRFAHLLEVPCGPITVLGAFHPSQQNTFTGRLTPDDARRGVRARRVELDRTHVAARRRRRSTAMMPSAAPTL